MTHKIDAFSIITLTTDFGNSLYPSAMKGVILSINPHVQIIDINHTIPAQNLQIGAFILLNTIPYYPSAVHVAVVDPGVGTQRRAIIIKSSNGYFVGPDNGLLLPIVKEMGIEKVYEITNTDYLLPTISTTFHARDIFAPVGAHLSKGIDPTQIGDPIDETTLIDFSFPEPYVQEEQIEGEIIFIDSFGNCITNIPMENFKEHFKYQQLIQCKIKNEDHFFKFLPSYSYAQKHELLFVSSSFNLLELASNQDNAQKRIGCQIGTKLTIEI